MAKSVKLSDIAEQVGVSVVTVSKALSGQKGVSEEMRRKIIQLADELGYHRPVSSNKTKQQAASFNIAVLIHEKYLDKYNSFYMRLYQNIAAKAVEIGNFTLMEVVTQEAEESCSVPKVLQENKADGLIIMGRFSDAYATAVQNYAATVPYVYLDDNGARVDADVVISDSFYGAYYLTNYLFEMGHKDIGFVGSIMSTRSITDRYLGYMKSLMEHGVTGHDEWIVEDRDANGKMLTSDSLKLPKKLPSAFVCNCDLAASILINRLENDGYVVPEDFSVVGYDNFLFPGLCDVELTTYEVDMMEMAVRSLQILWHKLNGEAYHRGTNIVEGRLVIRDSVRLRTQD